MYVEEYDLFEDIHRATVRVIVRRLAMYEKPRLIKPTP